MPCEVGMLDACEPGGCECGGGGTGGSRIGCAGIAGRDIAPGTSVAADDAGVAGARGTGIGSFVLDDTIACSTLTDDGAPPGGVRRDGRGLRSSLTAGAW